MTIPEIVTDMTAIFRESNDRAERLARIRAELARIDADMERLDQCGELTYPGGTMLKPYPAALNAKRLTLEGMAVLVEIGRA